MSDAARTNRRAAIQAFKRQGILEAAESVFLEVGLEGATIRAIAKQAGCATGTVYLHFETKEAVYAALLGGSLDRLAYWIGEKVADTKNGGPAKEVLLAFFAYYVAHPRELDLGLYLFQGTQRRGLSKEFDAELNDRLDQGLDVIVEYLKSLKGWSPERSRAAVLDLVSHMVGCLILENTGRFQSLGGNGAEIISQRVDDLLEEK